MEFVSQNKILAAGVVLVVLWLAESCLPFYAQFQGRAKGRLPHDARNLGLGLFNAAVLLVFFSTALAAVGVWATRHDFGLAQLVSWPGWLETALLFLLFDFWMYVWHRANHTIPFLWRFHRMHHSDTEMNASSAVRFHTGEVVFSALARLAVIPLLGMTIEQVLFYETVFLPVILFHHSNVRLPRWIDHGLLAIMVTPAMHRVHHSRRRPETNSNYGSVFPHWDFLARSFRLRKDAGTIELGLDGLDGPEWQSLAGMLKTPLATDRRNEC